MENLRYHIYIAILMIVLALATFAASVYATIPEQVHLAFGRTPDVMAVQWATTETFCTALSTVQYGTDPNALDMSVEGECFPFDVGFSQFKQSNHVAYMSGLRASTRYYYRVGGSRSGGGGGDSSLSEEEWSEVFHFRTAPDASTLQQSLPHRIIVYGDLGSGASMPEDSSTIMPWASREVQDGNVDMILHVGDFAYDLFSDFGRVGRLFMNEISNMSAYAPYMVDMGNHEVAFDFAHYTEFFRNQPSNLQIPTVRTGNGDAPNNWYFSWNMGLIHFVTLSSEIYFFHVGMVQEQWEWLKADLAAAQTNRSSAPWIIVNAHRSIYCSCDDYCDDQATRLRAGIEREWEDGQGLQRRYGVEELLYEYGVDLFINGHEHNYERSYDVAPMERGNYTSGISTQSTTNPPATIYIVTGAAGSDSGHEDFQYPQPDRTAFRTSAFGYSRMTVHNNTHLFWEQVECDSSREPVVEGEVIDSFWLIQEVHGPFNRF